MGAHELVLASQFSVFASIPAFEDAQRMAKMLAQSDMVPDAYRGRIENCVIALELSHRLRVSAFLVMQNLNVIHGRPSWSSVFVIGAINSSGKFEPLEFHLSGEGNKRQCYASSRVIGSGKEVKGPLVTVQMARDEGWWERKGSKWPNMTDIMLTYRAASFFGRLYAPEIMLGMQTAEELQDLPPERVKDMGAAEVVGATPSTESLNDILEGATGAKPAAAKAAPSAVVIDGATGSVVDHEKTHPAFELAKIIEGCERARTVEDLNMLEDAAGKLPAAEKAEALAELGRRREELAMPSPTNKRSVDPLFR